MVVPRFPTRAFVKSLNLIGFMGDKRVNFGKKIIFSDTIRLMKLILFVHVYDIILYINCVFCCGQVRTLAAMTTFFIVVVILGQNSGERL